MRAVGTLRRRAAMRLGRQTCEVNHSRDPNPNRYYAVSRDNKPGFTNEGLLSARGEPRRPDPQGSQATIVRSWEHNKPWAVSIHIHV